MTGFYGKLPAKGDFLSRNLSRTFTDKWDDWLQTGMHESRQALGDAWLQIYLTSPLWRFLLPPGVINDTPWAGVFMPSMDRVGRYFPMTVVAELTAGTSLLKAAALSRSWFESVEECLLEALDDEALDLDAFDARLQGMLPGVDTGAAPDITVAVDQGVRFRLDDELSIPGALLGLTAPALEERLGVYSLWWGQGSERIPPSMALCRGLPGPGRFTALLDGNWNGHGWRDTEAESTDLASIVADIIAV